LEKPFEVFLMRAFTPKLSARSQLKKDATLVENRSFVLLSLRSALPIVVTTIYVATMQKKRISSNIA
jgi:hypothetical protein